MTIDNLLYDYRRTEGNWVISPLAWLCHAFPPLGKGGFPGAILAYAQMAPQQETCQLRGIMCKKSKVREGERAERCRWQDKRGERVAAVGEGRSRSAGKDIHRAPQQETCQLRGITLKRANAGREVQSPSRLFYNGIPLFAADG